MREDGLPPAGNGASGRPSPFPASSHADAGERILGRRRAARTPRRRLEADASCTVPRRGRRYSGRPELLADAPFTMREKVNPYDAEDEIPERLLDDLRRAPFVPEEWVDRLPRGRRPEQEIQPAELDVLRYIAHGLTVEQAADALEIPEHAAQTRLRGARYALRAKNTTHAVAKAMRAGLIP